MAKHIGLLTMGGALFASVCLNIHFATSNENLSSFTEIEKLKSDSLLAVKLLSDKKLDKTQKLLKSKDIEEKELRSELDLLAIEYKNSKNSARYLEQKLNLKDLEISSLQNRSMPDNLIPEFTASLLEVQKNEINNLNKEIHQYESLKANARTISPVNINYTSYKVCNKSRTALNSVKKANELEINFSLTSNQLAVAGNRNIYFILSDSKGKICKGSKTPDLNTNMITSNMNFDYNLKDTDIQTSIAFDKKLKKDLYRLDIYVDGQLGGHASLDIK